jgi:hypothetical protein
MVEITKETLVNLSCKFNGVRITRNISVKPEILAALIAVAERAIAPVDDAEVVAICARLRDAETRYIYGRAAADFIDRQSREIAQLRKERSPTWRLVSDLAIWKSRAEISEARVKALEEALASAKAWHQSQDKALSKSGRADPNYYWSRTEHAEQIQEIGKVLSDEQEAAAWGRVNARAALAQARDWWARNFPKKKQEA